jgi:hypothetical protein
VEYNVFRSKLNKRERGEKDRERERERERERKLRPRLSKLQQFLVLE